MKRAYKITVPSLELGADRRIYDQLYYIEKGQDLRNVGYHNQLDIVRGHMQMALKLILKKDLDKERKIGLKFLQLKLKAAAKEEDVASIIEQALSLTDHLNT